MDGAFNFLEEEWARNGTRDISNELLNLSDQSDYAMESTSDLMDWSSLFCAEDNRSLFYDQKDKDASSGMQDFSDLLMDDNSAFTGLIRSDKDNGNIEIQQTAHQSDHPFAVSQNTALQIQAAMQQTSQFQQHTNNQSPAQLFIQHQPPVQQIQISQQQLQHMLPSQQQHLRISFQAASSTPMFHQPQQIILQQNAPIHTPQILLQPSQLQNPHAQVIISPQTHPFTTQQPICIPSNQKIQLVQQQQQQQQMFILNGSSSGSNFVNPSQIVLAPLPQTHQNSIIIQQPQVQTSIPNQAIMVQIGNQLFQLQTPHVEKNGAVSNAVKLPSKNGLVKISAKHTLQRNSPTLVDGKSKLITPMMENKPTPRYTFMAQNNKNITISSFPKTSPSFLPKLLTSSSSSQQIATTFSCVLPTPVAKVRPLECKSGGNSKVVNSSSNALELVNGSQEKLKSALEKMTPVQRQSFNNLKRSVPEPDNCPTTTFCTRTQISSSHGSLVSNLAITLASHVESDSFSNNFSTKSSFPIAPTLTNAVPSGCFSTASSKQSQLSKDFLKLSIGEKFKIHLMKDQKSALQPDTKSPFIQLRDSLGALASYHVFQTRCDEDSTVLKAEELYEGMSQDLIAQKDRLLKKYQHIMLNRSMVHHDSVEDVMLGRMFLVQEMSKLKEEKKLLQTDPDSFIPRPVLPPEEMAALNPKAVEESDLDVNEDEEDDNDCLSEGSICESEEVPNKSPSIGKNGGNNTAKHIVIKIKHCDGTFSASPSFKRPRDQDAETLDKIPPIKIARIRLKRVDVDAEEKDHSNHTGFFQVIENENKSMPKDSMNAFKTCNGLSSNYSKHTVTAVVTPFHKQLESSRSNVIPEQNRTRIFSEKNLNPQREVHPTFCDVAISSSPGTNLHEDIADENLCFDRLGNHEAILTGEFDRYSPKPEEYTPFISGNVFTSECCPLQLADVPSLCSANNETQMFASDSEEFLDSNLEIEMQSAIQSILSHRTE